MADPESIVIDDRLLIEHLLVGLPQVRSAHALHSTSYWYYRACRAAVVGAGGHLSGPFARLDGDQQERAVLSLLELSDEIGLPDPRRCVPVMADLARRHPRLNLLNLGAAAASQVLGATVWLSSPAASGILPSVLESEGIAWRAIALA